MSGPGIDPADRVTIRELGSAWTVPPARLGTIVVGMRPRFPRLARLAASTLLAWAILAIAGCTALSTEVAITPLILKPSDILRPDTIHDAILRGDYRRAIEIAAEPGTKLTEGETLSLARAEIAAGRFDAARDRLLRVLDEPDFRPLHRQMLWELSRAAYLTNDFASAHKWAVAAKSQGMAVMSWHVDLLDALSREHAYRSTGDRATIVPMKAKAPDIPRIDVSVDGHASTKAIIDTGAVLSIVSESFARSTGLHSLGAFQAVFYGLSRDPIVASFASIDSLRIGGVVIEGVPVAVMPDDKLSFFVRDKGEIRIDMLLGATFLKEFRLTFDYASQRLGLEVLPPERRAPASDQNLFFVDFRPFVQTSLNRHGWYPFLLDTGSEITFLNGNRLRVADVPGIPRLHRSTIQGLGGSQRHGTRLDHVEVGIDRWGGMFKQLPLYDDERTGAVGIIGQNFLEHFRVVVDFGRMRVDLSRR